MGFSSIVEKREALYTSVATRIRPAPPVPASTLPSPAPPLPQEGPPRRLGTWLFYWWGTLWRSLMTIVYATGYVASYLLKPSGEQFKKWGTRWARAILWGRGVSVETAWRADLDPSQPYVFVANHQNEYDIMAMLVALRQPFGFVAKAELEKVPFLGAALRNSPCVFVDRSDPRRSLASIKRAGEHIRDGNAVLVFAEGERSYSRYLLPFMRGAFVLAVEAGVPVVPVTIVDGFRVLHEQWHTARPGTLHVVVGTPISLEGKTRRDIPALMDAVRAQLTAELAPLWEAPDAPALPAAS